MPSEDKLKALAELKALREAKAQQLASLAAASASPPRARVSAPTADTSSLSTATPDRALHAAEASPAAVAASPASHSSLPALTIVSSVGVVDIAPRPPTPTECYARGTETEHCYVYNESRPHPNDVVSKDEVNTLLALQQSEDGGGNEGRNSRSKIGSSSNSNLSSFWDKTRSKGTGKLLASRPFMDFMTKAVDTLDEFYQQQETFGAGGFVGGGPSAFLGGTGGGQSVLDPQALAKVVVTPKLVKRAMFALESAGTLGGRVVTDVAFQPGTSDTFAVSLSAPPVTTMSAAAVSGSSAAVGATAAATTADTATASTANGLVLLFHSRRQGQPPLQFYCDHEVRCVRFSPFHDHLLVGGTNTGRIVSWYVHQGPQPAAVSFPLPDSHTTSIVQLWIRGDTNASSLVTLSQDGKVCTWTPESLRRPASVGQCELEQGVKPGRCAVHAADLQNSARRLAVDTTGAKLYLGGAEGHLYETVRRATHRTLDMKKVTDDKKHRSVITAVDCHPAHSDPLIGELVLTASIDGTCRLWLGSASIAFESFGEQFVHDVKWSPVSPSIFATADGSGRVLLWNLLSSGASPVASVSIEPNDAVRLQWDDSGQHLLVGTSQGGVVYLDATDAALPVGEASKGLSEWVSQKFAVKD